ncbi:MAG: hypothetical protein C3F14_00455, partial [Deltaproteobacteria bacterium]
FCETSNDGTVGGSHSCMYNLVRYSDRDRFRFSVGFFSDNRYLDRYRDLDVDVELLPSVPARKDGFSVVRKAVNWYQREYQLEKYLHAYLSGRKFDVLMLNNTVYESVSFVNAGSRMKVPVIAYERGIMPYTPEHVAASAGIDATIAVSDAILRNLRAYGFRSKSVRRIYDGIDPELFEGPFDRAAIKKELGIPSGGRVIGIVGNVRAWKGQKYFIEAVRGLAPEYPDLYGLIVGGWGEADLEYVDSLKRSVDDAGLGDRVRFLGYRNDTPALLSILDVFVHASTSPEPFGMVLLEAMAARVPIVATRFGGPLEILDNGECGALVPPEDGRALAEACRKYFSDEGYRKSVVEKAYARLQRNFHIRSTVEEVGQLIETVRRNNMDRC